MPEPAAEYDSSSTKCGELLEVLERVREAALVAGARVPVEHALRHHAVDPALRLPQHAGRRRLVAAGERLLNVLDRAAHLGAQAHVVDATHLRLAGALAGGFDVRHELVPLEGPGV